MVHIKGFAINGAIERIKNSFGEQGYRKILEKLNEEDRMMFSGLILTSQWYSLDSFVRFIEEENRLFYSGDRTKILQNTEIVVDKQLRGIYRLFIKMGSPEFVVSKIGSVNSSYFSGVKLEVLENRQGTYIGRYTGFEKQHEIFQYVVMAFYKKALEISGAKDIRVEFTTPMSSGAGYSEIKVSWSK